MEKLKIVFFTGAGISAESGVQTFRNSPSGLWNEYKIEEVASIDGWKKNPKLVLDFYNKRRKECLDVMPNKAHELIASLESKFDVTVITQNVDNLHERAGSSNVIHLHGELLKVRSEIDEKLIYERDGDIHLGDLCEKGGQLRPHIVWFGEMLDESKLNLAMIHAIACDVCVVVGSSLQVAPANQLPQLVDEDAKLIIVDPADIKMEFKREFHHIKSNASQGVQQVVESLNKIIN